MDDQQQQPARTVRSFQFNPPTLICFLYIATYFTVISAVIGVVLAYIWRREENEAWEDSHYTYLIRTFWIAVLGCVGGGVLILAVVAVGESPAGERFDESAVGVFAGIALFVALTVLLVVRCALSLVNAQKNRPMPKPRTWLA